MDSIWIFEINIIQFLQSIGAWFETIMGFITLLGDEEFYLLVMPLLYWCINATLGFRIGAMLVISSSVANAFKIAFHTPRPYWLKLDAKGVEALSTETSFGFPSGHSTNAAGIWGLFAASVRQRWFSILMILIIFLIGLSRIVLGVHFISDVLGGWLLGAILLILFIKLEEPIKRWVSSLDLKQKIFVSAFSSLLLLLPTLIAQRFLYGWTVPAEWIKNTGYELDPFLSLSTYKVAGTWLGFAIGFSWLHHKIGGYVADGTLVQRVIRYLIGLVGVMLFWYGLNYVFPDSTDQLGLSLRYLRYALVGLWISALAPLIFIRLGLAASTNED
jgi:membrane-associated phospholipid phosphatase